MKSEECRRKTLWRQFDNCDKVSCPDPKHLCCDNCAKHCNCKNEDCGELTKFPGCLNRTTQNSGVTARTRVVSMQQKKLRYLVRDLISKSPDGQLPTLTNLQFMLGFSYQQIIKQVLENCDKIFTLDDVISNIIEIWHIQHDCKKIMESISSVFGDCATENFMVENVDEDEEEESDTWLGDWERLMDDDELFELAVGIIFLCHY